MTSHPGTPGSERIGTEEHYRWLHGIVKALIVFNGLDAIFTLYWVQAGLAREANAFLRLLVEEHPTGFVAAKLALFSLSSLLLWRLRDRPAAVVTIFGAFVAYYVVLLQHLAFSSLWFRQYLQ